ncbi:MAG TPA: carboxypeptidase regulatory-like domain-containing protein [Thermoanaerobaculia bacterium]|nr:carboxypeptidase regulatory-like domain-containing protein [Thermoanaerobaculia bacterium]
MRTDRAVVATALILILAVPGFAAMTGSVMDADGKPIAGAKVSLFAPETVDARIARIFSREPQRAAIASTTSDSRGGFSLDTPKLAVVHLRVEAAGYAPDTIRLLNDDEAGAIVLSPAPAKKGSVTANGKPVVGAVVAWLGGDNELVITTDAEGRYTIPDPTNWAFAVIVAHSDYAPLRESFGRFGLEKSLDLKITAGAPLTGRVVAADRTTPVAKATVEIDGANAAVSADDGTFTIPHAPATWNSLTATLGDRIGDRAAGTKGAIAVKLGPASLVSGTVRDAKSQLPLAGAEVRLSSGSGFAITPVHSAMSDAKGNFSMAVRPGNYQLTVLRPGHTVAPAALSVKEGQKLVKNIWASQRARVTGTVLDEDKNPVAAAKVTVQQVSRDPMNAIVRGNFFAGQQAPQYSGPDGHFVARNVEPDADVQMEALKKGFPPARSGSLHLAGGERRTGIVITIPRGVLVTGRVVDKDGRPVAGAVISTQESDRGGFGGMRRMIMGAFRDRGDDSVKTANDGTFFLRVKEGTWDFSFHHDGYSVKAVRAQQVAANGKPILVTLDPAVEITGRVTRGGAGVEGVQVSAVGEGGMSDAMTASDGTFQLTNLSPGQVILNAMKQDAFVQQTRPVMAPSHDVLIDIPPGGRIAGHVVDKTTHQPVTNFEAGISTSRGGGGVNIVMPPQTKSFTSDDGTFTLDNVPAGAHEVVVRAAGYTTAHVPGINVEEGKTVPDVAVELDTGVKLTGRVTGPDGAPVGGALVRLQQGGGRGAMRIAINPSDNATTITEPTGEYELDALESGEQTFQFTHSGYLAETRNLNLSGKDARLDVQLSAGMAVTGLVVTDGGVPVGDATVRASSASEGGFGQTTRSDSTGAFRFDGLAPGHYAFSGSKSGYADGRLTDVDITASPNVRISLGSGGSVYGHVTGLTDTELQNATVVANGPSGSSSAPVDSTGAYRIEGAPTGTIRVSSQTGRGFAEGKSSPIQSVQLDPGGSVQVDIAFKSNVVVQGRVTRNGVPLAGAMVIFTPRNAKAQTNARATTEGNGSYQVTGLDDATYSVQVIDLERMSPFSTSYDVHGSGTFDITIRTATLSGHVADAASSDAINGASIEITRGDASDAIFANRSTTTDAAGSFFIDSLPPGAYHARASKNGYANQIIDVVVGDSSPDPLQFKLSPADGVTLKVVDARDGRALAASVVVVDSQGRVISPGEFPFGNTSAGPISLNLGPGSYRATISAQGYATQVLTIVSPSSPTVGLTPGGSLLLRATATGSPRGRLIGPDGSVYISGAGGVGPRFFAGGVFLINPSPGTTLLQNLIPGTFTLQVLDGSDNMVRSIPVTIVDGQQAQIDV